MQLIKKVITGFLFLVFFATQAQGAYDGIVLRKNELGTYKIDSIQDTTYILEYPCDPINSIKLRFDPSFINKKVKIRGANLDGNPSQIDVPGLEYAFCYLSIMLDDRPVFELPEESQENLRYTMTVDYSVRKEWVMENAIDSNRINIFKLSEDKKTWQDMPGDQLYKTDNDLVYTSTEQDQASYVTIGISGNTPENALLHRTGVEVNKMLIVSLVFATIIYFIPYLRSRFIKSTDS